MGWTQEWFSSFKSGVSHDDDAACSQHSSTRKRDENVSWVKEIICVKIVAVCQVAEFGKVQRLFCWCLIVVWVMSILAHTARVSLRHPTNPPVYLPAPSVHENADSDNVHSQVLWFGSIPAMRSTALFGFSIVTLGQSDDWVQLCICFPFVPSRHAQERLYHLLPCKLNTSKTDLIDFFINL